MRRLPAVLVALTVASTLSSCGQGPQKPVTTLDQLSAALKDIGVCPANFPRDKTPYITLSGVGGTLANASFGCVGKGFGADGFATAADRDETAGDDLRAPGGPWLVGTGGNLWILTYDRDEKGDTRKTLKRLKGDMQVVTNP